MPRTPTGRQTRALAGHPMKRSAASWPRRPIFTRSSGSRSNVSTAPQAVWRSPKETRPPTQTPTPTPTPTPTSTRTATPATQPAIMRWTTPSGRAYTRHTHRPRHLESRACPYGGRIHGDQAINWRREEYAELKLALRLMPLLRGYSWRCGHSLISRRPRGVLGRRLVSGAAYLCTLGRISPESTQVSVAHPEEVGYEGLHLGRFYQALPGGDRCRSVMKIS